MRTEYYSETNRELLFSLYDSSKKKKENQFRNHKHADLEIAFIIDGTGIYILNEGIFDVNAGDLFVARPNEQHCIPTITSDRLIAFNIRINSFYLWNVCSDFIEPSKIHALVHSEIPINQHFQANENLIMLAKKIWKLFHEDSDANRFKIRSYILDFMKLLSNEISVSNNQSNFSTLRLFDIQKAISYIKQNYNKQITLEDIAKSAAMSRSYFSNTFKLATGLSPYEYLLTTRIDNARRLLLTTDYSVLKISYDCGFKNVTNFNLAFKKKLGITPGALRQLNK